MVSTQTGKSTSNQPSPEDNQWFFAIDWGAEAAAQYDPGCIEEPHLHESVHQAKERLAAGPKPYNLDECIEVQSLEPDHDVLSACGTMAYQSLHSPLRCNDASQVLSLQ